MELHFLTGSTFKIETAQLALAGYDATIVPVSLDIPEIQADTNAEIARTAALQAAQILNKPVLREDHGFFLNAVPGFPGPYMAYVERIMPPQDLLDLLRDKDHTGYFTMALAYATPQGDVIEFSSQVACEIAPEIRPGTSTYGWDRVICLPGNTQAIGEYPVAERYPHFAENFARLAEALRIAKK